MLIKHQKNIFFIIFYIVVLFVYDSFTNTYIVTRENYHHRLIKNTGYCNNLGYGFYEFIFTNYSSKQNNITALNFNNMPSPSSYFFDYKKKGSINEIILIGAKNNQLSEYLEGGFKIVYSHTNCFYLKK